MKKTNLHWGHYIAIFYTFFVLVVITALIASFQVDRSLVIDDYYAKDIAYQEHFDKKKNLIKSGICMILHNDHTGILKIQFDKTHDIAGSIRFYRPSDKSLDFEVALKNTSLDFNTTLIAKGKWVIKVDWTTGGKDYYKEEMIFI